MESTSELAHPLTWRDLYISALYDPNQKRNQPCDPQGDPFFIFEDCLVPRHLWKVRPRQDLIQEVWKHREELSPRIQMRKQVE